MIRRLIDMQAASEIAGPSMRAHGTSEGVKKAWDERGRGSNAAPKSSPNFTAATHREQAQTHMEKAAKSWGRFKDAHEAAADAHKKAASAWGEVAQHERGTAFSFGAKKVATSASQKAWSATEKANQ